MAQDDDSLQKSGGAGLVKYGHIALLIIGALVVLKFVLKLVMFWPIALGLLIIGYLAYRGLFKKSGDKADSKDSSAVRAGAAKSQKAITSQSDSGKSGSALSAAGTDNVSKKNRSKLDDFDRRMAELDKMEQEVDSSSSWMNE